MSNDAVLLQRYTEQHSEQAFRELVDRHLRVVYSSALRRCNGNSHAAADVAQRVFIALAQRARSLTQHTVLTAWLYATTRNVAVDLVRAEQRRQLHEKEAHIMHELLSPDASADWNQLRPVLDGAIDELNGVDREAVLLRFFDQHSFAEIGTALAVSEDAARMRTERALDKLRALLAKRGVTSSAAALAVVLANHAVGTVPAGLAAAIGTAAMAEAAAAAATTATLATLLGFMSTTKIAVSAAILALATAGYQLHVQRNAEISLGAAKRNHETVMAKLRDLERRTAAAERTASQLRIAANTARFDETATKAQPATVWNPITEGQAFIQRHPEIVGVMKDWFDAQNRFLYGSLIQSRNLDANQTKEFFDLIRGGGRAFTEVITTDGQRAQLSLPRDNRLTSEERNQRLHALLGDEGLEEKKRLASFRSYRARQLTASLAGEVAFTDAPLAPREAERLMGGLASALPASLSQGPYPPSVAMITLVDWDALDAQARSVLSAPQFAAWERISNYERSRRALTLSQSVAAGSKK